MAFSKSLSSRISRVPSMSAAEVACRICSEVWAGRAGGAGVDAECGACGASVSDVSCAEGSVFFAKLLACIGCARACSVSDEPVGGAGDSIKTSQTRSCAAKGME